MRNIDVVSSIARTRAVVLLATLFYAFAIHFSHIRYLYPVWEYYGFTYRQPTAAEYLTMLVLLVLGGALLPRAVTKPSSIIVLLLFLVVYVPTVVITLALDADRLTLYGPILTVLAFGFCVACVGARQRPRRRTIEPAVPGSGFVVCMLGAWIVLCAILVASYGSVMSFAGLDETYDQRAAGASTSLFMGYTQTYFSNVFSPALIAYGLVKGRSMFVGVGIAGCLIMYAITAQRTVILLPFAMLAVFFALRSGWSVLRSSSFLLTSIGAVVMFASAFYPSSLFATFLSIFLVFRTLGLPGLTFSQYFELFSAEGFTWWSHIRGVDLLVPVPLSYVNDPAWPNLGYMIGDRLYNNVENNANANLFSGDGVAAAGAFGVGAIAVALACWLVWLDRASIGWNRKFVILVSVPLALSLTNGHLFTTLLSFGGIFWMLTFYVYKPGR